MASLNIFGPVPSGTFSHFADHHYFSIILRLDDTSEPDAFNIMSALKDIDHHPLSLSGSCPQGILFDHSPILNLIHALPEITHLVLCGHAWEALNSRNFDVHKAFPCGLDILKLRALDSNSNSRINELNSLCVGLKPKALVLVEVDELDPETLLSITSKTGAEVLKLDEDCYNEKAFEGAINALRQSVVVVSYDII